MSNKIEAAAQILASPKMGASVAASTTAAGISTWVDLIPDDIGKVATLVGICLSLVYIFTTVRKHRAEFRNIQLRNDALELDNAAKRLEIERRKASGLPARRAEDCKP